MCGRYSFFDADALYERFEVPKDPTIKLKKRYNIAPGQEMPVVLNDGEKHLDVMSWGLIPYWAKDPRIRWKMINARAESVATKPSFRKAFASQRCLVPASGFFEWKSSGGIKQPFFVHLTNDAIMALAGLYDLWVNPAGKLFKTYTIITTNSNEAMRPIHIRMPAVIDRDHEDAWISSDIKDSKVLLHMLQPFPSVFMESYPVSDKVNIADFDDPKATRRIRI